LTQKSTIASRALLSRNDVIIAAQNRWEQARRQFSDASIAVLQRKDGAGLICKRALAEIESARKALSDLHGSPTAPKRAFQIVATDEG